MLSVIGPRRAGRLQRRKRPLHTARLARYLPLNHSPSPERGAPPTHALPLPRPAAAPEQAATAATLGPALELAAGAGAAAATLAGAVPQPVRAAAVVPHSDAAQPASAAGAQLPRAAAGAASLPRAAAQPRHAGFEAAQAPAAPEQLFVPDTPTSSADGGTPFLPSDAGLHRRAVEAAAAAAAAGGTDADSQGRGAHAAGASTPRAAVLAVQAVPDTVGAPTSSTSGPLGQACSATSQPQPAMEHAGQAMPDRATAPVGDGGEQPSRKRGTDASPGRHQDNAKRWQRFREEVAGKVTPPAAVADQGAAGSAPPHAASPLPVCELSYPQLSGPAGSAPGALARGGLAGMAAAAAPAPSLSPQEHSAPAAVAGFKESHDVHGKPGRAALSPAGQPREYGAPGACFGAPQLPAAGAPLHAIAALGMPRAQPAATGRSPGPQSLPGAWPIPDQTAGQRRMQQTTEAAALPSRPGGASSAPQRTIARCADRPADAAMGAPAGAVIAAPGTWSKFGTADGGGSPQASLPERAAKRQRLDSDGFYETGAPDAGGGGLAAGSPMPAQRCSEAVAGTPAAAWRGDAGAVGGLAGARWGTAAAVVSPTAGRRSNAAARASPAGPSLPDDSAMAGSPAPAGPGDAAAGSRPAGADQDGVAAQCSPAAAQRGAAAAAGSPAAVSESVAVAAASSPVAATSGDALPRASAAAGSLAAAAACDEGAIVLSSDSESDEEAAGLRARMLPGLPCGTAPMTRRFALSILRKGIAWGGTLMACSTHECTAFSMCSFTTLRTWSVPQCTCRW